MPTNCQSALLNGSVGCTAKCSNTVGQCHFVGNLAIHHLTSFKTICHVVGKPAKCSNIVASRKMLG